ncbi:MAG: hypothetical protein FJ255_12385 [Phycisphaerae bacterium]|nr:hypothetical protein [Phycisphaerae bacterium]
MPRARSTPAAARLAALFLAAALPLIVLGWDRGRGVHDQANYHLPAILRFAEELPRPNLSDYDSATTPGYHLALAAVARLVSSEARVLQLASVAFTLGLLVLLVRGVARRSAGIDPLVLCLPMACSLYVFSSGAWLLPDNAGWLGVLGVLLLALRPRQDGRTLIAAGAVLAALVFVRQIHLWAAAPIWAAALLPPLQEGRGGVGHDSEAPPSPPTPPRPSPEWEGVIRRLFLAVLATLPAFAIVAGFVLLWGGLTPPTFQKKLHGGNPAAPAFILSVAACLGVFFAPMLAGTLRGLWRERRGLVLAAAGAGLVLAAVPETTFSTPHGRYSGLWNLVRALDALDVADRTSPVLLVLAPIGAVLLLALLAAQATRERLVFGAALLGFIAAQAASRDLWQRYTEPFLLMAIPLMAARLPAPSRLARVGPHLLAGALAAVTVASLAMSKPATVIPPDQDPARSVQPAPINAR